MEQILMLETDVKIAATYEQNRAELQAKFDKYKTYEECLKSHNLKLIAINKIMQTVVTNTNLLLNEVCTFSLNFELNESSMDIWIVEKSGLAVPLIGGSGFQKAIISLCFRLTLTSLLSSTSMFMIMDEPLQFADKRSLAKVQEMLLNMHVVYKFVFIISHIDDIKEILTYPLQIRTNGKSSHISNIAISNIAISEIIPEEKKKKEKKEKEKYTCDICNIEILKSSYKLHIKSQSHISKCNKNNSLF
jgi:DNA repair exonuclease SbcCD ATPase subunit